MMDYHYSSGIQNILMRDREEEVWVVPGRQVVGCTYWGLFRVYGGYM